MSCDTGESSRPVNPNCLVGTSALLKLESTRTALNRPPIYSTDPKRQLPQFRGASLAIVQPAFSEH